MSKLPLSNKNYRRGMAVLMKKGYSKEEAFEKMKNLCKLQKSGVNIVQYLNSLGDAVET